MTYLPPGCAQPDKTELDAFCDRARGVTGAGFETYHVRWIGMDHDSTEEVLDLVVAEDKTGTFTLPWIVEHTDHPAPASDDYIVLIDFGGHPRLLLQLTEIETVAFGEVTETHTAVDGTPVRDLKIWKPMHTIYWNAMLNPFGLEVEDDMPVWVEKFRLVYAEP